MNDNNWNQPLVIQPKTHTEERPPYERFAPKAKRVPYKKIFILVIIFGVVLVLVYIGVTVFNQYRITPKDSLTPTEVVSAVGKIALIPNDEVPEIKPITDLSLFANQPFFIHAAQNDQLLIFKVAKKAILYRPSTNQIIEMAAIQ